MEKERAQSNPADPEAAATLEVREPEAAETPVCRRLRTKMYYVVGREHVNLRESSPTAQYWCSHTATVMGPDEEPCSPESCQPDRGCFETE
jgi:hypothetical protein